MTEHNDEAPEVTEDKVAEETPQPATAEAPAEGVQTSAAASDAPAKEAEGAAAHDEAAAQDTATDEGAGDEEEEIAFLDPDDDEVEQEVTVVEPKLVEELRARITELDRDLEGARRETASYKDRLLRSAADYDNFRKRAQREKADLEKFAVEKAVSEMLPVLDNLERALDHAEKTVGKQDGEPSDAAQGLLDGVQMVLRQFRSQLEKNGVKGFESKGELFDPERHEAVQQVESDTAQTGEIVEVYQRGYFIHDRLLRPAMVVVARNTSGDGD
ncbi:MAG: nucleotide exchange factor GrpE [Myxococcota bacterium]